jgi:hypothetical protein
MHGGISIFLDAQANSWKPPEKKPAFMESGRLSFCEYISPSSGPEGHPESTADGAIPPKVPA